MKKLRHSIILRDTQEKDWTNMVIKKVRDLPILMMECMTKTDLIKKEYI